MMKKKDLKEDFFKNYEKNGYYICKTNMVPILSRIRRKFISVFDQAAQHNGLGPITCDQQVIELYHSKHRNVWVAAYDQLRSIPEVVGLCNHTILRNIAQRAGIKFPSLAVRPIIRADMPFDPKWDFPPHQDYVYNQGSLNSITIWTPLQDIEKDLGPLEIIPGSHLDGKVLTKSKLVKDANLAEYIQVPLKVGQMLVFSQFLHHISGINISNKIRFSLQMRYNDIQSKEWGKRYFYINQKTTEKTDRVNFKTHFPSLN